MTTAAFPWGWRLQDWLLAVGPSSVKNLRVPLGFSDSCEPGERVCACQQTTNSLLLEDVRELSTKLTANLRLSVGMKDLPVWPARVSLSVMFLRFVKRLGLTAGRRTECVTSLRILSPCHLAFISPGFQVPIEIHASTGDYRLRIPQL